MKRHARLSAAVALVAAILAALPSTAAAQAPTIPVKIGDKVWVTAVDGWDLKGVNTGVSPSEISVSGEGGTKHFAPADIWRVSRPDSVWSGALTGAAIGSGLVLLIPQDRKSSSDRANAVAAIAVYAAVGALLDRANVKKHVVYERAGSLAPATPLESVLPAPEPAGNVPASSMVLPVTIGQQVTVTTVAGLEVQGIVTGVGPKGIDVKGANGAKHIVASDVRRIVTPHTSRKGLKIGAVYGVGSGALAGAAVGGRMTGIIMGGAMGGAMCATIGSMLDHAAGGKRTIYEKAAAAPSSVSIAPIVTLHSVGVGGSIRWR